MNFTESGSGPTILFVHGSCITAQTCYGNVVPLMKNEYRCVLCGLDGHEEDSDSVFGTIDEECEGIEKYLEQNYNSHVEAIVGLSLGSTIIVRLLERARITADKIILDGVYCVNMGKAYAKFAEVAARGGVRMLVKGKKVPDGLVGMLFGEGNTSVLDMLYPGITGESIKNVCSEVYLYNLSPDVGKTETEVLCVRGENEPISQKSYELLARYIKNISQKVIPGKGHSQFLYEQPDEYARMLKEAIGAAQQA